MVSGRPQVIQGSFCGNRLQIAARHHQTGIVQPSVRGPATQLPPTVLNLHPRGTGQRLPEVVQRKMEALFNASFSDVRVHVGTEASAIGALAFTHGSDLYFTHGQYNPNSPHGLRLIGHELTHVLQQKTGRVRNPFGSGIAVVQDQGMEAEAERMGLKAGMPQVQGPSQRMGAVTQPCRSPLPSNPKRPRAAFSPQVAQPAFNYFRRWIANRIFSPNSYGHIPGYGFLGRPHRKFQKLEPEHGGFYDQEKGIVVNKDHSKKSQESTYEHELAHLAHSKSPGINLNEPEDLLMSELVAKRREAIMTLKQYKEGEKGKTLDEELKIKEAEIYRQNPKEFHQLVIEKYARNYQKQFPEDNLKKVGAQILEYLDKE
jgi:hypothetical protein